MSNKNIAVCSYPTDPPDHMPCNFQLFPKIKITMKCKHFEMIQNMEAAPIAKLKTLTKEAF